MVVFSKSPFTDDEIDFFSESFEKYGYKPILIPGLVSREPYTQLLGDEITLEAFYDHFDTKAHFVTDDSPYFLSHEKPMPGIVQNLLQGSLLIVTLFLAIPFAWLRRKGSAHESEVTALSLSRIIPYFASLGMGFILIELALLQKLILMLGNPTTTFAILLFTLLLSSGAGSYISGKIIKEKARRLPLVLIGVVTLGGIYLLVLNPIIYQVIAEPFELKVLVSVLILSPIGLLMGMPLPTGIRMLKRHRSDYVPRMWAINGAFSVLGAVLAVTIGITQGSSLAMLVGIIVYLASLGVSLTWRRKSVSEIQTL